MVLPVGPDWIGPRDPQGLYLVAGNYRMPVLPGWADVLLSRFSPVSTEDFRRAAKPGGC